MQRSSGCRSRLLGPTSWLSHTCSARCGPRCERLLTSWTGASGRRVICAAVGTCPPGVKVFSEVFCGLLFSIPHLSPPPPPGLLGFGRFGAHDYPPSTYLTR